ncbi:hypothetical protein [Candidatus Uabimicrobium sp. HlEnr_7]|uniref:hypothetical protein n=1 Tax=Candidatus Uabimicrobium helgolandensis TaxID=3095367 RepID=UPI003556172E
MKYLLFLFVFVITINASVSIQSVYTQIEKLSQDKDMLFSHRDSASVLSYVWGLSKNYTVENLLSNENTEITHKKVIGAFGAMIKDKQIFLLTNTESQCISLSPHKFGIITMEQNQKNAIYISLPNKSKFLDKSVTIFPTNNDKKIKKANRMFHEFFGNTILGVSVYANGHLLIHRNDDILISQRVEKGKIYPISMAKFGMSNIGFVMQLDSEDIHGDICQIHYLEKSTNVKKPIQKKQK